jgi:hypothetical protein
MLYVLVYFTICKHSHPLCTFHPHYATFHNEKLMKILHNMNESYTIDKKFEKMLDNIEWKITQWMRSWKNIVIYKLQLVN